ncbi:MAG: hypothetical protein A4E63_01820 [Syntrophorhabdus sp. PtaU1.Bin050]|nr:MAG: hypothetical protein A4E63_01820 [Syntrophorhabdus sp. PtaU1.Bin050]
MTVTIIESTDNGRIALQERTLTDGSKVYTVLVRDGELPCRNKEIATSLYAQLADMIENFDII